MADAYRDRIAEDRLGMAQAELRFRIVELVETALEEDNVSQRELAERMGLSEGAVSQVLGGDRNLTINKIAAYADAVDRRVVVSFHRRDEGLPRPPWTSVQTTPGTGGYLEQTQEIRGFSDARS